MIHQIAPRHLTCCSVRVYPHEGTLTGKKKSLSFSKCPLEVGVESFSDRLSRRVTFGVFIRHEYSIHFGFKGVFCVVQCQITLSPGVVYRHDAEVPLLPPPLPSVRASSFSRVDFFFFLILMGAIQKSTILIAVVSYTRCINIKTTRASQNVCLIHKSALFYVVIVWPCMLK